MTRYVKPDPDRYVKDEDYRTVIDLIDGLVKIIVERDRAVPERRAS